MRYSPFVRPMLMDSVRCVLVKPEPRSLEPRAYRFLLGFASDDELVVIDPTRPDGSAQFCPVPGVAIEPGGQGTAGG